MDWVKDPHGNYLNIQSAVSGKVVDSHGGPRGAGYPSAPGLAMQQSPLAPRILAAINPTAGSVT